MSHAVQSRRLPLQHLPRPRLPRTRDEILAATAVVLALAALVLAVAEAYDAGAVVSFVCVLVGGWSQMVSENRMERFESVVATVGGAVLLAVCLAYGSNLLGWASLLD